MELHYTDDCLLICDLESYAQWPKCRPTKGVQLGGLWRTSNLQQILKEDDLSCAAWRAPIPREILLSLQQYCECHAELIEMAQAAPEFYLKAVKKGPIFALLYATYWLYRSPDDAPSIQDRMTLWENLDIDDLLLHMRFNASKSFIRALSKVPVADSTHYLVRAIRDHWPVPAKRRLLQHLDVIKAENAWLLSCHPTILDPAIHRLVATAPNYEEYTVIEVVCDLSTRRELAGWDPWPYRNSIHTWAQLLNAYNKFFKRTNHIQETLPEPPVDGIEEEDFCIKPMTSRTSLRREAREMVNCIEVYAGYIATRKFYAYRLLAPERATVLIKRQSSRWEIAEAMITANQREVLPSTRIQIGKWLRAHRELKNSQQYK